MCIRCYGAILSWYFSFVRWFVGFGRRAEFILGDKGCVVLENGILSIVLPTFIPSVAMLWVTIRASKETTTKSIKKFTVKSPKAYKDFLAFTSPFPAGIGLILFLVNRGEGEIGVYIFLSVFSLFILLLRLIFTLLKLDVDEDMLTYTNFIGLTKKIHSAQVNKIVIANQSTIIYANGKKFGSLSKDCLHIKNFHKYCEEKGIVIQNKSGAHITK